MLMHMKTEHPATSNSADCLLKKYVVSALCLCFGTWSAQVNIKALTAYLGIKVATTLAHHQTSMWQHPAFAGDRFTDHTAHNQQGTSPSRENGHINIPEN